MKLFKTLILVSFIFVMGVPSTLARESETEFALRQNKLHKDYRDGLLREGYVLVNDIDQSGDHHTFSVKKGNITVLIAWESGWVIRESVHIHSIVIASTDKYRDILITCNEHDKLYDFYYIDKHTQRKTSQDPIKSGVYQRSLYIEISDIKGGENASGAIALLFEDYQKARKKR